MTNGTVPKKKEKEDTTRQTMELCAAVSKQLPHITPEEMQFWIQNQGKLQEVLAVALVIPDPLKEWELFYQEVFGITVDLSGLAIPKAKKGFNRLVVMLQDMTAKRLFDKCTERFQAYCEIKNLSLVSSERIVKKTYAIRRRDLFKADEEEKAAKVEFKNVLINESDKPGISHVTLEECWISYLFDDWQPGRKNLDFKREMLCLGSHCFGSDVPHVLWNNNGMRVNWCDPRDWDITRLRFRAAVSV
jgi:hypothetical protein